jgi:hypothetical protein
MDSFELTLQTRSELVETIVCCESDRTGVAGVCIVAGHGGLLHKESESKSGQLHFSHNHHQDLVPVITRDLVIGSDPFACPSRVCLVPSTDGFSRLSKHQSVRRFRPTRIWKHE